MTALGVLGAEGPFAAEEDPDEEEEKGFMRPCLCRLLLLVVVVSSLSAGGFGVKGAKGLNHSRKRSAAQVGSW